MSKKELKLGYLYPKLLNIYGDYGNVLILKKRCKWRNIELIIDEINIGDRISNHDMYFLGGGQDLQQIIVAKELQLYKSFLHEEMNNDAVFLSICGGYQLLGKYYQPYNGQEIEGISLLESYTVAGGKRFIGNVTTQIHKDINLSVDTLVGFENHSGITYLEGNTKPISTIITGNGNNGEDKTEGARYKNVFGTYMHGPFLSKNPHFADYLIELSLYKKYGDTIKLKEIDDREEFSAHYSLINKKY